VNIDVSEGEPHCQHDFPSLDCVYEALTLVPLPLPLPPPNDQFNLSHVSVSLRPLTPEPVSCVLYPLFRFSPVTLVLVRAFPLRNSH